MESIVKTYNSHLDEIGMYLHEDFLDKELDEVAELYLSNKLDSEVHLVSIVVYNEKKNIQLTDKNNIHEQIVELIAGRYSNFDNSKIDLFEQPILRRITYIVFPVWNLRELAKDFQSMF